nr:hypothetical protein [Tanacetum cinerariifolium]
GLTETAGIRLTETAGIRLTETAGIRLTETAGILSILTLHTETLPSHSMTSKPNCHMPSNSSKRINSQEE